MKKVEGQFVDTNILVYAALSDDKRHDACKRLLASRTGPVLFLSHQILAEFYATVTNPKPVSTPLTSVNAIGYIEALLRSPRTILLPIPAEVSPHWLMLLKRSGVLGQRVFDFQIAATMLAHGVDTLATYNWSDFKDIAEIEIFEPEAPQPQ
jgi:predicted nucleic acid-binding protein